MEFSHAVLLNNAAYNELSRLFSAFKKVVEQEFETVIK
jgi:hypothetical protein